MPKLCFISLKSFPVFRPGVKGTFGGAEVVMCTFAMAFAQKPDYEVNVMVADYGQEKKLIIHNCNLWSSLDFKSPLLFQMIRFLRIMIIIDSDVYILRSFSPYSGFIGVILKIFRKKVLFMVAHDREADGLGPYKRKRFLRLFYNLIYRVADVVVVQNNYQLEKLKMKFPKLKMKLLQKGIAINNMPDQNKKEFDCIWIGRSEKWKNPDLFIEICKSLPQLNFVMICPVSTKNPQLQMRLANEAKSIDNLRFFGIMNNQEVLKLMNRSKMICTTSIKEGFPSVVVEAASLSLPIVSLFIDFEDLFDKYDAGVFCHGNLDLMKKSIFELSNDTEKRMERGKNARKYVLENHDLNKQSAKFESIISSL